MPLTACFSHSCCFPGCPYCLVLGPGPPCSTPSLPPSLSVRHGLQPAHWPELDDQSEKFYWVSLRPQDRKIKSSLGTGQD